MFPDNLQTPGPGELCKFHSYPGLGAQQASNKCLSSEEVTFVCGKRYSYDSFLKKRVSRKILENLSFFVHDHSEKDSFLCDG